MPRSTVFPGHKSEAFKRHPCVGFTTRPAVMVLQMWDGGCRVLTWLAVAWLCHRGWAGCAQGHYKVREL